MKNIARIFYITLFAGCATFGGEGGHQAPANVRTIYIAPSENEPITELTQDVNRIAELTLAQAGFRIVVPFKIDEKTAIQVCASNDKKTILNVKLDNSINGADCFASGTGMAMRRTIPPNYYVPLIIADGKAHNYYSSDRRTSKGNSTTVNINEIKVARGATIAETYLVIFLDKNRDKAINKDELWFAKVAWK